MTRGLPLYTVLAVFLLPAILLARPGDVSSETASPNLREGLATEIPVGNREGLKHDSSILCDALVSLPKCALTDFVGTLCEKRSEVLNVALREEMRKNSDGTSIQHVGCPPAFVYQPITWTFVDQSCGVS